MLSRLRDFHRCPAAAYFHVDIKRRVIVLTCRSPTTRLMKQGPLCVSVITDVRMQLLSDY